ncbi:3-hydroxyisobutyryl-CoA hydrolase-like protein 2 mitochondrial [Citrus sinensis]|uniref:3-hydroxyisobutyryl-CoA hydrolase-like protein 2 mitochondrial n=1 Tax=Citrus sinensis TaxID=2711 RepID=A0ACB8LUK5_CITSI|nr:3-hydroxyisobutyryl-CoA hydrolase-like protein 2 mitochondrial [Citrus sinensis]
MSSLNDCNDADNMVLVEEGASSRTIILNRPNVLNALLTPMLTNLVKATGLLVFYTKGNGRSFCAGGDVVTLYRLLSEGRVEECKECFRTFYSLMYRLNTYLKPHVAIMNGITMGGGAGLSVHGSFCIATEKTVFAIPEVLIGSHPDAGASYYLSHLPGHLGEYLGLTGGRLSGEELLACGFATHYIPSARLPLIEEQLRTLAVHDFSAMETFLAKHSEHVYPNENSILHRVETLNKCFGHDTVEEIIGALESEVAETNDEWCISTLKKLREAPPLSLKISLKSIQKARFETLEECLKREYRMSMRMISRQISNDFCEGVRTRLVEKSFAPKWDPPCLEQVTEEMVNAYFERISVDEPELELPNKLRKASHANV